MQIDRYIPATKAKAKLLELIRIVDESEDTFAITKNGVPAAVLMSMEQYEEMRETMEILADRELMEQIWKSRKEVEDPVPAKSRCASPTIR